MFDFDLRSVRWGLLAMTAGVMVAMTIAHFLFLRPLKRRVEEDLKGGDGELKAALLSRQISSVAATCLAAANLADSKIARSDDVTRARCAVAEAGDYPHLELALASLEEAMSSFEAALGEKDRKRIQAAKIAVVEACMAVTTKVAVVGRRSDV